MGLYDAFEIHKKCKSVILRASPAIVHCLAWQYTPVQQQQKFSNMLEKIIHKEDRSPLDLNTQIISDSLRYMVFLWQKKSTAMGSDGDASIPVGSMFGMFIMFMHLHIH